MASKRSRAALGSSPLHAIPNEVAHAAELNAADVARKRTAAFSLESLHDMPLLAERQAHLDRARIDASGLEGVGEGVQGIGEGFDGGLGIGPHSC